MALLGLLPNTWSKSGRLPGICPTNTARKIAADFAGFIYQVEGCSVGA